MPGTTPRYSFPYAVLGDPPHGPNQELALAQAVETALGVIDDIVNATTRYAEYSQASGQSVATSTNVRMTWDTTVESHADISYSGGIFTVNRAGTWLVTGTMQWTGATGNAFFERAAILSTTSATSYRFGGSNDWTGIGGGLPNMQLPFVGQKRFAAGDTFAVWLWQTSGAGLSTRVALDANRIAMKWTGP